MTTARVHSLTHGGMNSLVKSAVAKTAMLAIPVIKVQRVIMKVSLAQWLVRLHRTHRSRQELAGLSERLLADIGVSEAERQAELRKPFWKTQGPG